MDISLSNIPNIIRNKKARQVFSLYASTILSTFASMGVTSILTRNLDPKAWGDLKFVQNICSFLVLFITWGYFYTGTLVIARSKEKKQKHQLVGAITTVTIVMSALFSIIIFGGSWIQTIIYKNELGSTFRIFAPFLIVYPFELYCLNILVGDNKIHTLAVFRLAPKIAYLLGCLFWQKFLGPLSLYSALGLYIFSLSIFIAYSVYELKPSFLNLKENISFIHKENKGYGFPLYAGTLFSTVTTQLGGLSIAYFIDTTHTGFFNLALSITMPLAFIPSTIGTAFFREFANMDKIPKKVIKATVVLSVLALVVFMILIKPLIILLCSKEYISSVPLAYYTAIGATFQGFGDLYNRYISAQGLGVQLRNVSLIIALSNLIGYTLMVYLFGVNGAAVTRVIAGLIYLVLTWALYKRSIQNVQ
jgi:O-antigen/teichoic acid export membrane protein